MTQRDKELKEQLNRQLSILRDLVRGVAHGHTNGLYIYGRPGTSKTWTVKTTLEKEGVEYVYQDGHLTPMGLFETLANNPNSIILMDDLGAAFENTITRQLLLAALGDQPPKVSPTKKRSARKGKPTTAKPTSTKAKTPKPKTKTATKVASPAPQNGGRIIKYRRQGVNQVIVFTGSIIAISNVELHSKGVMEAIRSRVNHVSYNPTDDQLRVLILQIASQGYTTSQGYTISKEECVEIASLLIDESLRIGVRLDLRNLTHKAYPSFVQWKLQMTENHWHDLVRQSLLDQVKHSDGENEKTRLNTKASEHMIVQMLFEKHKGDRATIIAKWCEMTGKSERAIYRRMSELGLSF